MSSGAASSAGTVADAEKVLGTDVAAWVVETANDVTEEVKAAAREGSGLELTGLEQQACEACLLSVLGSVRLGTDTVLRAPQEAVEQVRLAVRQGAAIDNVLRVVWMCHTAVQDHLLAVISEAVPPGELVDEVRVLSRHLLAFVDLLVRELSAAYEAERTVWQDRITTAQRQVVEDILETSRAPEGADQVLRIRLTEQHLAAVLWTTEAVADSGKHSPIARYGEPGRVPDRRGRNCGARPAGRLDRSRPVVVGRTEERSRRGGASHRTPARHGLGAGAGERRCGGISA